MLALACMHPDRSQLSSGWAAHMSMDSHGSVPALFVAASVCPDPALLHAPDKTLTARTLMPCTLIVIRTRELTMARPMQPWL
jgi:hypothetical protein